jgi:hypothetical protein
VAYRTANSLLLHIVGRERTAKQLDLRLPKSFVPTSRAKLFTPESGDGQSLPVTKNADGATLSLPNPPRYCVVEIPLQ